MKVTMEMLANPVLKGANVPVATEGVEFPQVISGLYLLANLMEKTKIIKNLEI